MRGADSFAICAYSAKMETSPHAWSRPDYLSDVRDLDRNISTCVEQTEDKRVYGAFEQKHLHMRGADSFWSPWARVAVETSPHAWSRLLRVGQVRLCQGNISTCVEQTFSRCRHTFQSWKHLHMRGADHFISVPCGHCAGNISTCVEQTFIRYLSMRPNRKHLHMRGADLSVTLLHIITLETSPHAWSRRHRGRRGLNIIRNISTCVEQTLSSIASSDWQEKHLHMRGADSLFCKRKLEKVETSPHAWSRPPVRFVDRKSVGNISTCVEQTA